MKCALTGLLTIALLASGCSSAYEKADPIADQAFNDFNAGHYGTAVGRWNQARTAIASDRGDYYMNHWYIYDAQWLSNVASTYLETDQPELAKDTYVQVPQVLRDGARGHRQAVRDQNEENQAIAMGLAILGAGMSAYAGSQGVSYSQIQPAMNSLYQAVEILATPEEYERLASNAPTDVEIDYVRMPVFANVGPLLNIGRLHGPGYTCTASFVRPRVALTNAHCVTDASGRQDVLPSQLKVVWNNLFSKQALLEGRPTYEMSFTEIHFSKGYSGSGDHENDWALLVSDEESPWGHLGINTMRPTFGDEVVISGHSGDLNGGMFMTMDYGCPVQSGFTDPIEYDCATWKGSSGSPILVRDDEGELARVVGVHACGAPLSREESKTYGRRYACGAPITPEIIDLLVQLDPPTTS